MEKAALYRTAFLLLQGLGLKKLFSVLFCRTNSDVATMVVLRVIKYNTFSLTINSLLPKVSIQAPLLKAL